MSLRHLSTVLLLVSTLIACPGPDPQGPELPSTALGESTVGAPFERSLAASGGKAPLSYSAQGLPEGIAIDPQTGLLTGSPTTAGSFDIQASVTDAVGRSDQQSYTLLVLEAPSFVTSSLPPASVDTSYTAVIEATGGKAPLVFGFSSGSLPPGLALDEAGTLSGVPSEAGTFSFELSVTDAHGAVQRAAFTLEVLPALVITTTSLPDGDVAREYFAWLTATGGQGTLTWSYSGTLPSGFFLYSSGVLYGVSYTIGFYNLTVTVTDEAGRTASRDLTLFIHGHPEIRTTRFPDGQVGMPYSFTIDVLASPGHLTWNDYGSLPPGLTLEGGVVSGTPTIAGSYNVFIWVMDERTRTGTATIPFTVHGPPTLR